MAAAAPVPVATQSFGDSAVRVTVDDPDRDRRQAGVRRFRDRFLAHRPHGVLDVVAGPESLLVEFDPLLTGPEHVEYAARLLAETIGATSPPPPRPARQFAISVVFDEETGPDLAEVAAELDTDPAGVVAAVTASTFTISVLAAAMAPMMDGLAVPRPVRRRHQPRTDVPPGAIMIAGTNAIIQPFPGPTGWRVIGRTPHTVVDITRAEPVSFAPGDIVRFVAVDGDRARQLQGDFLLPAEDHS
jgi:KipI family sensor histidine kinase inhibitor